MTKKHIAVVCIGAISLLLVFLGVLLFQGKTVTVGRCLIADDGTVLLWDGESPIRMSAQGVGKNTRFNGLSTGDKILVLHDGINESYSGQTGAYICLVLEDGTDMDIPDSVSIQLQELGWLNTVRLSTGETIVKDARTVGYEYGGYGVSLSLLNGWDYAVDEYDDEKNYYGIRIYPKTHPNDVVSVHYVPNGFGVCGTGLTSEASTLGEYEVSVGTYDDSPIWRFIVIKNTHTDGDFAITRAGDSLWWSNRGEEAMLILNTLKISTPAQE